MLGGASKTSDAGLLGTAELERSARALAVASAAAAKLILVATGAAVAAGTTLLEGALDGRRNVSTMISPTSVHIARESSRRSKVLREPARRCCTPSRMSRPASSNAPRLRAQCETKSDGVAGADCREATQSGEA
eukprot:scaffold41748_cov31-Tisochrysis_lutea.AAC.4